MGGEAGVPLSYPLILSGVLFSLGTIGFFIRRNVVTMLMCVELMLNAANIAFVAFARHHAEMAGQIWVFIVITLAAGEAAIGLALVVTLARHHGTMEVDDLRSLRG